MTVDGYCYKYDISLPHAVFYQAVLDMRARLSDKVIRFIVYFYLDSFVNFYYNFSF